MKRELMKVFWVNCAIIIGSTAFGAQAADLYSSSRKDTAGCASCNSSFGWPGFYFGINGGYGWGAGSNLTASSYQQDDAAAIVETVKLPVEGGFGGGQIGYNIQRDRIVFGIEADIQGADLAGDAHVEAVNSSWRDIGYVRTDAWAKTNLDWFGTVRARAGYTIANTLIFATGGFAFGGATNSLTQSFYSADPEPPVTLGDAKSSNATLTGYAIGGGIEAALSPSWSIKAEYLRIDLGSTSLATNRDITYPYGNYCVHDSCSDNGHASIDVSHVYDTFRIGLNRKIGQSYEPLK